MNECSVISDLPASTPTGQLTSHFGENNGDKPSCGGKDDACRRGALEGAIGPHVAGDSKRTPPAAATAAAHSGSRTPPGVVQISSVLSERRFLGTSGRPLSVSLPIAIEPKPGACGRISETTTRQKRPLHDRLRPRRMRKNCAVVPGRSRTWIRGQVWNPCTQAKPLISMVGVLVGVDGPRRHRVCQAVNVCNRSQGSRPNDNYQDWFGHVETCLSNSWG